VQHPDVVGQVDAATPLQLMKGIGEVGEVSATASLDSAKTTMEAILKLDNMMNNFRFVEVVLR
jgi:hypothetical protein